MKATVEVSPSGAMLSDASSAFARRASRGSVGAVPLVLPFSGHVSIWYMG